MFLNELIVEFLNKFQTNFFLSQKSYMDCCESCDDGRRSESVSDEREMGEMTLDRRIQDLLRTGVAKRRSILVEQIHQFLGDHSGREKKVMKSFSEINSFVISFFVNLSN